MTGEMPGEAMQMKRRKAKLVQKERVSMLIPLI